MADEAKIGAPWQDDELDAIVADYFAMFKDHLSGHPYVKSAHSKALMARVGRTHRSVEFKHQNISAVLACIIHERTAKDEFHTLHAPCA
jgi:hypothetical protein